MSFTRLQKLALVSVLVAGGAFVGLCVSVPSNPVTEAHEEGPTIGRTNRDRLVDLVDLHVFENKGNVSFIRPSAVSFSIEYGDVSEEFVWPAVLDRFVDDLQNFSGVPISRVSADAAENLRFVFAGWVDADDVMEQYSDHITWTVDPIVRAGEYELSYFLPGVRLTLQRALRRAVANKLPVACPTIETSSKRYQTTHTTIFFILTEIAEPGFNVQKAATFCFQQGILAAFGIETSGPETLGIEVTAITGAPMSAELRCLISALYNPLLPDIGRRDDVLPLIYRNYSKFGECE